MALAGVGLVCFVVVQPAALYGHVRSYSTKRRRKVRNRVAVGARPVSPKPPALRPRDIASVERIEPQPAGLDGAKLAFDEHEWTSD